MKDIIIEYSEFEIQVDRNMPKEKPKCKMFGFVKGERVCHSFKGY